MASRGKKMKLGVREKNEKGERKMEENYIKKGEKVLKMQIYPWSKINDSKRTRIRNTIIKS